MLDDPTARGAERVMIEIYRRFPRYMGARSPRSSSGCSTAARRCWCTAPPARTARVRDRDAAARARGAGAADPRGLPRLAPLAGRRCTHRASLEARLGRFMPADELEAAVDTVIDVREVYLDAALEAAVAEFGSIDRYLEIAAGLDAGAASSCTAHCSCSGPYCWRRCSPRSFWSRVPLRADRHAVPSRRSRSHGGGAAAIDDINKEVQGSLRRYCRRKG